MTIYEGDVRAVLPTLPADAVQTVVTSPPYYGLRDYGAAGQIGHEPTVTGYVDAIVEVMRGVRRVLRRDGTCWLNLGDGFVTGRRTPEGLPPKSLRGVPWRTAFALQSDGWLLRSDIVWAKPNATPESVRSRPVRAHEYVFLFAANPDYYYDADAISTPAKPRSRIERPAEKRAGHGRTYAGLDYYQHVDRAARRSVWTIPHVLSQGDHYATMPDELASLCVKAGSRPGDLVFDPFCGVGTTGAVARRLGRRFIGVELVESYALTARARIADAALPMLEAAEA